MRGMRWKSAVGMLAVVGALHGGLNGAMARAAETYVLGKGSYGVVTKDVTVRDEVRGKDLELRVRVPTSSTFPPPEGWPLVVFSHGAGGSRTAFKDLLDFWASHGFASVAVTHADSIELARRKGTNDGVGVLSEEGRRKLLMSVDLGDRVADCKFVLDALDPISAAVVKAGGPELKVDRKKLAIAGHSAGAFTTQLCAGVKARAAVLRQRGLEMTSVGDDRFKAAIVISGQGLSARALDEQSWSAVKIPMLVIAGSQDFSPNGMGKETPESRQDPFKLSRGTAGGGPPAYLLYIEGATHGSYQGKGAAQLLGEAPATDVRDIQNSVATATTLYLNTYLQGDDSSREILESNKVRETIPGKVTWEWK